MKVKSIPEDFIVEELTDNLPGEAGEFAFYRLEKTSWNTPDALAIIRRRWNVEPRRISYGGLKDRHAATTQYLSIWRGPMRNLSQERLQLTFLGRMTEPYTSTHIRANRFEITLRNISDPAPLDAAARELLQCGVPNYFDDQRFGSVSRDGRFVALEMVKGDFESALKLAIAEPYEHDRAIQKKEKAILGQHWQDWPSCKAKLPRGGTRSIVEYLVNYPQDFKGAIARLPHEIASLYLSAYQSHVWNRVLDRWLRAVLPESLVMLDLKLGLHVAPRHPCPEFEVLTLPLASARLKPEADAPWNVILNEVLSEDGLTLETMKIAGLQRPYFSKGERAACLKPEQFRLTVEPDELYPKRSKVILNFELPRGCYATMIVKRLTAKLVSGKKIQKYEPSD